MTSYTTTKDLRAFKVFTIEHGTVIDHIDAGHALKIIDILKLSSEGNLVTTGLNLMSSELGKKDIIKVELRELTPEEVNWVALFAPHATINIIRDYGVTKKFKVELPEKISKLIICPNPMCISNHEPMNTLFYIKKKIPDIHVTCHYCEKQFHQSDIRTYNS